MSFATAVKRLDSSGVPLWRRDDASLFSFAGTENISDLFKSDGHHNKGQAKKWDHMFSEEAARRKPSSIKAAVRTAEQGGMISLGAGTPSSAYFPFDKIRVEVSHPSEMVINMAKDGLERASDYSLDIALNYGQGTGSAQMLRFVTEHTELIHNPPYADWGCCLTTGSTSAWDSALRMFCEKGDYIIVDEYSFSSALETAWALGVKALPVPMDKQGLIPEALDSLLGNWDAKSRGARKPFLLYMVPTGQNPTGAVQPLERRKEIYELASKHDLYIVEDEPYYYLQMPPFKESTSSSEAPDQIPESLVPSYLSLDTDGRVLRLDSLSKTLAPGSRLGWVTGAQQVIEKFIRQHETSSQHPSGFSQVIVYNLLNHHWGHLGFLSWLQHMAAEYAWRRDTMAQACQEFLPGEIVSYNPPRAGMFQWIEINWKSHPLYRGCAGAGAGASHSDIEQAILAAVVARKVFLTPGSCFWAAGDRDTTQTRMFFRATFATCSREELREAVRRFGDALRVSFSEGSI